MRRISHGELAAVTVVLLLGLSAVASLGIPLLSVHSTLSPSSSHPPISSKPVTAAKSVGVGAVNHPFPIVPPLVAAKIILQGQPPAVANAVFTIPFALAVTNTTPDVFNTTLWISAYKHVGIVTTFVSHQEFGINYAAFTPPNPFSAWWVYSDSFTVNYKFMNHTGFNGPVPPQVTNAFVNGNYTLTFNLTAQNHTAGTSTNTSATATTSVFFIPKASATLTISAVPAATPLPFTIAFNVVAGGIHSVAANTTAWNSTVIVVASEAGKTIAVGVASLNANGNSQSFVVNYPYLLSGSYGPQNLPAGSYNFSFALAVENAFHSFAAAAATSGNSTVTVTTGTVLITSTPVLHSTLPFSVNFTLSIGGNSGLTLTTASVALTLNALWLGYHDPVSGQSCGSVIFGIPCPVVATKTIPFTAGTASYSTTVTVAYLTSGNYSGSATNPALLPVGEYQFVVTAVITNPAATAQAAQTTTGSVSTYPVVTPASGTVVAKQLSYGSVSGGIGNVSITVTYTGEFILGANVTVQPVGSTVTVFVAGVFVPGAGTRSTQVIWPATQNGSYTVTLTIATFYGVVTSSTPITVNQAGGQVVVTKSTYNNQTLLAGLAPGVTAAILLVVGVIVGLVVALLLARSMWGAKPSPAPQPWTSAAGGVECSVCHMRFDTEDELKAHAKSAHGMD